MVLKYLIKQYPLQTLYFGIANVVANGLVMLRFVPSLFHYGFPGSNRMMELISNSVQYGCFMGFPEYRR